MKCLKRKHVEQHAPLLALLGFLGLSLALTYPLPFHLVDAVEDRQDALLNVWIMAWDGHQLLSDPLHLFDANIFYPYRHTLAYSELLLGNALLALPITSLTGNPVLGYNMTLLLSFVLSGLGMYFLVVWLTRSPGAGFAAGILFAFSSYRLTNLAQAQLLTTQWLPLAVLSAFQLAHRPRPRQAVAFVLFSCLQTLSSFYYGFLWALIGVGFSIFVVGGWLAARRRGWLRAFTRESLSLPNLRASALYGLLAVGATVLLILPFVLPYFRVQRELGFERTLADSEPFSASLYQYAMVPPTSVLYGRWLPTSETPLPGGYPTDALFPGLIALLLALGGILRGQGRVRWFFLACLIGAFGLSLGPRLYLASAQAVDLPVPLPYAWLYAWLPGFKALRAPVRFDVAVTLSLAVLAGHGVAALNQDARVGKAEGPSPTPHPPERRRKCRLAVCILLLLVVAESWVWPAAQATPVPVGDQVPAVYRWLAVQPPQPILELPMAFTPGGPQLEYQYLSTYHWQTTPDGYSGFIPPEHGQIVYEMERFPWERSVSLLQGLGIGYVVIHTDRYPADRRRDMERAMAQIGDLKRIETFGVDQVYQLQPRSFDPAELEVRGYLPPQAVAGQPYTAYALVLNPGPRSYAVRPTDSFQAMAIWEGATGRTVTPVEGKVPLVTSPGGASVVPLPMTAPQAPGLYRLTLDEQGRVLGDWTWSGEVQVGEGGEAGLPVPIALVAWRIPSVARPGGPLEVGLKWRTLGKIDAYYSEYVKVLDGAGRALASWDGQPQDGAAPTLLWVPGDTIEDRVRLTIPADIPAGEYLVEVGMYRAEDLTRCLMFDAQGQPVDRWRLGTVRIEP